LEFVRKRPILASVLGLAMIIPSSEAWKTILPSMNLPLSLLPTLATWFILTIGFFMASEIPAFIIRRMRQAGYFNDETT
jgi:hypothetical protein